MGFFSQDNKRAAPKSASNLPSLDLIHRMECQACPLDKAALNSPKMKPTGPSDPIVYIIGEAPGKTEDRDGVQFVGQSGQMLRPHIPDDWIDEIRWSNTIRCRPPENRTPEHLEIECCRPRMEGDIARTKPVAVFGFGNVPLQALTKQQGILKWRGRRLPVKVNGHSCWYYPMLHPAFIERMKSGQLGRELELVLKLDLRRAFAEVESLPPPVVHDEVEARKGIACVTGRRGGDLDRVLEHLDWCATLPSVGLDYETTGIRPYAKGSKICTVAIGPHDNVLAFPIDHSQAGWTRLQREVLGEALLEFYASKAKKAVHNLAFELEWTGVVFGTEHIRSGPWEDTMSQASILDERKGDKKPGCFALDFLTMLYFGFNIKKFSNVNTAQIDKEPLEKVLPYNGMDTKYHHLIYLRQEQLLEAAGLAHVYRDHHLERVPTFVLTQIKGVPIDQDEVKRLMKKYSERMAEVEVQIQALEVVKDFEAVYGRRLVISNLGDLAIIFRDMLKLIAEDEKQTSRRSGQRGGDDRGQVAPSRTLRGKESRQADQEEKYSLDEESLNKLDHPLSPLVLRWRKAAHQLSTYISQNDISHPESLVYADGLIHHILNSMFAETGRSTAEDPNMQNYPKRDGEAREVRRQVAARPGFVILSADYGQIQVRNIAMESNDKVLCRSLWERHDFHADWRDELAYAYPARVGGKKMLKDKDAMKNFRTDVKNQWTFPLFFGCSADSAAGYLKMPKNIVYPIYDKFWETFSGVLDWQMGLVKMYNRLGYVQNLTGRRRHAPLSKNKIINSPIQGDESDIVFHAFTELSKTGDTHLQAILEIHDDLTFHLPIDKVDYYAEKIITTMLDLPFDFITVPIAAELSFGPNWMDMKEIGTFESDIWFK